MADDIDALTQWARKHPDIFWPSSNGYGIVWVSSADTAFCWPAATETDTRHGLIAQDGQIERGRLITGESTCRGSKDIDKHIADRHRASVRTVKTANARYGRGRTTALSS